MASESEAGLSPEPLGLTLESAHHGRPVHHLTFCLIPLARREWWGLALERKKSACHMAHQHLGHLISTLSFSRGAESREPEAQVTQWGQLCRYGRQWPPFLRAAPLPSLSTQISPSGNQRPESKCLLCHLVLGVGFLICQVGTTDVSRLLPRLGVTITPDNVLCK